MRLARWRSCSRRIREILRLIHSPHRRISRIRSHSPLASATDGSPYGPTARRPPPPRPSGCTASSSPAGALPQAAERLDADPALGPDEVRVRVELLNLDAASFRQLTTKHAGDGDAVRAEVLEIVATRGKMQNPVTGSGGMLVGVVDEVGPESTLGPERRRPGRHPGLAVADARCASPTGWRAGTARSEQVPAEGTAILFGRSIAARIPDDLPSELSMAVMDVCGAPGADRARRGAVRRAADPGCA